MKMTKKSMQRNRKKKKRYPEKRKNCRQKDKCRRVESITEEQTHVNH